MNMNIYKWNTPNIKYPDFNQIIPINNYNNNKNNRNIIIYKYIFTILIISIISIIILSYYNGH